MFTTAPGSKALDGNMHRVRFTSLQYLLFCGTLGNNGQHDQPVSGLQPLTTHDNLSLGAVIKG